MSLESSDDNCHGFARLSNYIGVFILVNWGCNSQLIATELFLKCFYYVQCACCDSKK